MSGKLDEQVISAYNQNILQFVISAKILFILKFCLVWKDNGSLIASVFYSKRGY